MGAERPDIRIIREITLAREHFLYKFPVLYISQNPQTIFLRSVLIQSSLGTYLKEKKYIKISLEIKSTERINPRIYTFLTYCRVAILPFLKFCSRIIHYNIIYRFIILE